MNHLFHELAPVTDAAWAEIEEEASRTLKHFLTGRRLVDVSGPKGWDFEAASQGHVEDVNEAPEGVRARKRTVQPLVEYRAEFWLPRTEIDAIERGARDADLSAVVDAARHLALAEDDAIFNGASGAGIEGIATASTNASLPISDNYGEYPSTV